MKSRLEIHEELCSYWGNRNVYFQPPPKVKLKYPAIVYSKESMPTSRADDGNYLVFTRYKVTTIEESPDTGKDIEFLLKFPDAKFLSSFVSDGLYHNVFTIINN